ncbi:hypothetical protein QUB47_08090 [Microcoleus sp. AT9_B5]
MLTLHGNSESRNKKASKIITKEQSRSPLRQISNKTKQKKAQTADRPFYRKSRYPTTN